MADPYIVIVRPTGDTITVVGYFPNEKAASAWATENLADVPWVASRPIEPDTFVEMRACRRTAQSSRIA